MVLPLFTLIKLLVGGPLIILAIVLLWNTIKYQLAWIKYKKVFKGLPVGPNRHPIYNHLLTVLAGNDICNSVLREYRRDGRKTRWFVIGDRPSVATVDLDFMKAIVLDEPSKHINRFRATNVSASEFRFENLIFARDDQWRRLRRVYAPALRSTKFKTPAVIDELETSISKLLDAMELRLDEQQQQQQQQQSSCNQTKTEATTSDYWELPVHELVHRFSMNLVLSSFYKQHELIDFKARECHWTNVQDEVLSTGARNPFIRMGLVVPETQWLWDWLSWHFQRSGIWRRQLMGFIEQQNGQAVEARRQLESGGKSEYGRNMIDYVIDRYLDGKLTRNEYFNSTAFLLSAADVTSVDALVHVLYELAIRPAMQDKLRASIQAEGTESTYLGWVINEALRLLPPAPVGCSREIACDMQIESGRHTIPEGTFVMMLPHVVHRLEEYWGEDADEFRPERWADTSRHHPMQYLPFGAGLRQCPGRDFAMFEMKRLLVALLTRYEFDARPDVKVYNYDTPFLVFLNKHSESSIRVRRLSAPTGCRSLSGRDNQIDE